MKMKPSHIETVNFNQSGSVTLAIKTEILQDSEQRQPHHDGIGDASFKVDEKAVGGVILLLSNTAMTCIIPTFWKSRELGEGGGGPEARV